MDWEWYNDIPTKVLFLHLIIKANHKDKRWQGRVVKRGQLITSLSILSTETGLSIRSIRTSINKLKSTHELTVKTTSKFSVLELVNYSSYQDKKKESDTPNDMQFDTQETNERQQLKNDKNDKKKRNIKIPEFIDADLWNDFMISRESMKCKPTERAITLLVNKLSSFKEKGLDPNKSLEDSIENGWKGVFEPKSTSSKTLSYDKIMEADISC